MRGEEITRATREPEPEAHNQRGRGEKHHLLVKPFRRRQGGGAGDARNRPNGLPGGGGGLFRSQGKQIGSLGHQPGKKKSEDASGPQVTVQIVGTHCDYMKKKKVVLFSRYHLS